MAIDLESLVARLDRVEAELALRRLVHDYCIGADHRDAKRWDAVWTDDAVWRLTPGWKPFEEEDIRVYRGRAEIRHAVCRTACCHLIRTAPPDRPVMYRAKAGDRTLPTRQIGG